MTSDSGTSRHFAATQYLGSAFGGLCCKTPWLMMGRRQGKQGQFYYSFDLDKVVPPDHLVRHIDGVLDLGWVHKELAAYYSHTGRRSIDPVLMIRMLIVSYVFAIRSERRLCADINEFYEYVP